MLEWYAWLSQLNAALSEPLTAWSERLNAVSRIRVP